MTPDIVANAIVAAIATGAVAGDTDAAKVTIADAYEELKSLVKKKFGHDSDVAEVIDMLEAKPDSTARKILLAETQRRQLQIRPRIGLRRPIRTRVD
jgi:hypothetical protein